ncbi:MAG: TonB-dependent receptor plug [Caulobacteraceae bacterium]|nr:MAG: TonB-dependent receptor plug [Caulobacteraceae bacterium]
MKFGIFSAASVAALAFSVGSAQAQTVAEEEIVVTAQKREQSIQDTPLAISAFGAQALQDLQVSDVADLASVAPGLQGVAVSSGQPLLSIRGIGSNDFSVGADPALGVFIDEVYVGRSAGAITNLFDVERVEVVRGPQGTLFGRNTTAGAISIIRNQPTQEFEASAAVTVAELNEVAAQAIVSGPVSDELALRGSIYSRQRDGYIDQVPTGEELGNIDSFSARIAAALDPSDGVRFNLSFDFQRDDESSAIYQSRSFNGAVTDLDFHQSTTNLTQDELYNQRDIYLAALRGAFDLGPFTLTSITAYRTYQLDYQEDTDGGPANLLAFSVDEAQQAVSQEFRLNYSSDRIDWFVGASYFSEDIEQTSRANYNEEDVCGAVARVAIGATLPCGPLLNFLSGGAIPDTFVGLPSVTDVNNADATYSSWGVYTDLTYHVSDDLRLIAGVRFSNDDKEVVIDNPAPASSVAPLLLGSPTVFLESTVAPVSLSDSWSDWSPRFAIQYDLNDDLMAYVSAARGYKSGGFNLLVPSGGTFDPEIVTSYEAGLKGSLAEGRLIFDMDAFYYEYQDLQVQIVNAFPITENAGEARGYGLEASFQARPTDALHIGGSLMLLDAEYTEYSPSPGIDYKGNRLNRAPSVAASLQADYTFVLGATGELTLGANVRYQDDTYHSPDNNNVQFAPTNTLTDVRASWSPNETWTLTAFVNNVFDEQYITQTQQLAALGIQVIQAGEPRIAGLRLNADF